MKVTTYLIFLSSFAILGHAYLTCQDCGDSPCKDINDNGEVKVCDEGALGCLHSEHIEHYGNIRIIERRCSMELEVGCAFDDHENPGDYDSYCICDTPNCNKDRECFKTCPSTMTKNPDRLTCQDCGDSPCKDVNDNGEVKECDEGALGCLYSEKHEQEGDIFIIERRCSMELDVSCEFDDHEGTPGDYDHFCICNTPNCNIDRECFKTCQNGTSTTPKSTTSQDHVHLTCQDCGDSPCKDINDNGEVKVCDEGALGCLYSEHHEQEGDITTIERRCSMELEIECVFDDNEGKPGDYDHYCICDTPNCNKDRECFKTCKNGTTSTVTPSTTSQNHARLTCQDCGDIKNCKDINDNGEVKECDEGTVGCFYSEHYEEAVDVMRIERRCAKEIEIACVFDENEHGDYDYYCVCDTPNCNKDRECFKTCKNGTTTVTQSSTSQTTPTTTSSQTCLKSVPTILILLASISILKLL